MDKEGKNDLLFADECMAELYTHFQKHLPSVGLDRSLSYFLMQWHSIIKYTMCYLAPQQHLI